MNRLFMKLGFIIILSSVQCLIIGTKNQQPNLFENPVSRNLKDSNSNQKTPQVIQVKTNQTKAERKLQFLKIVQNILKKAEKIFEDIGEAVESRAESKAMRGGKGRRSLFKAGGGGFGQSNAWVAPSTIRTVSWLAISGNSSRIRKQSVFGLKSKSSLVPDTM